MQKSKLFSLLAIFSASLSMAIAQAFQVGQQVSFNDRPGTYGGGQISGKIVKDRGANWEYAGRYEVRIDGTNKTEFLNASDLQAGGGQAHPAAQGADAKAGINHPNAAFKNGEPVNFFDRNGMYGGGDINGSVIADRGPSWEYAGRYEVKMADGRTEFLNASDLKKGHVAQNQAPIQRPDAQAPAQNQAPVAAAPAANRPAAPPPAGAVHAGNDWGRPPARGNFKYGKPNLGQMLGHNERTPPGLKPMFIALAAGDESPVGRWYTRTGGVFSKNGQQDSGGHDIYEWGNPEVAELVNVMPNGTWSMNNHGKITNGQWFDVGQNVIRLVNFADGYDWAASVHDHMITFKSDLGISKEGNRY